MSILNQVTKGRIESPPCVLLYGPDGVGKSSFGAGAPGAIFYGPEKGSDHLDVSRFPTAKKFSDIFTAIDALKNEQHGYKTLVIDSLDWLEPLLFRDICEDYKVKTIEHANGGYGKGYVEAQVRWLKLKDAIEDLRLSKQINIVLIGHSDIVNFADPSNQTNYQRYELKLHKRASALWREYVDAVLFANFEVFVKEADDKVKVFGDGARVIHTERRPGWDAKNRYGLPLKMDLSWDTLVEEIKKGQPESFESIMNRIDGLMSICTDAELKEKAIATIEKAGNDTRTLLAIANRLAVRLETTT